MNIIEKVRGNPQMWELFTKKEEYCPPFLDKYQRFPYYLSKYRNVMEPMVSKYLIENGLEPQYPNGKKFAVCLTHDVDVIRYNNFAQCLLDCSASIARGNLNQALKSQLYFFNKKNHPYYNFREIINLERKYHAKSSFFFLAHASDNWDYRYNLEEVSDEIKYILDSGWEVGLHGSHEACSDLKTIIEEKKRLEKVVGREVLGYRNHYLRFMTPNTWELLSKAGFKYDTTYGYADCVGFRNGMCHPFKPFNQLTEKEVDIIEFPLTVMDGTLFDYMKLDSNGAWEVIKNLLDIVEKYNGVFTLLWHNTHVNGEYLKLYEQILKYCYQKNAWLTSCEDYLMTQNI